MGRFLAGAILLLAVLAPGTAGSPPAEGLAARVVILANSDDPGSLAVARHYAQARGVPSANLLAFPMPTQETVAWPVFVRSIWEPLRTELIRRGWIDAVPAERRAEAGRQVYLVRGHRIAALVVCRGVPLRISEDREMAAAAVDSELSLLAANATPARGHVPNPLFAVDAPGASLRARVVEVSRLDGPTVADASALVDRALQAEHDGLLGRAYIDLAGPKPLGDSWLLSAGAEAKALGFETEVDRGATTMPETARCDAPAIYFGWYAPDLTGPFALPGFRFPPGAIAVHIHSLSAATLRSAERGWCGPLVARGATATVGNVYEPYLGLTHRPDLLFKALARGDDWADAAYESIPVLSWQGVAIGDPLYRPFAVPLSRQVRSLADLPPHLAGYAALREMRRLEAAGRAAEALAWAREALRLRPNLALGLAVARRLRASGQTAEAGRALVFAAEREVFRPDEWELAAQAAEELRADGQEDAAIEVYRRLLLTPSVPEGLRDGWIDALLGLR